MKLMNKKQQQSELTRKRIADAARAMFVQKGYKASSIEDIVQATGSSKGNIYYHFKSKEGLFLHLMEEWDREWEANWLARTSQYDSAIDKLYAMAEQLVKEELNHPLTKAADEFFNSGDNNTEVQARIAEMLQRHLDFNKRLLQEGIDKGQFRQNNIDHLAIILEGLFLGLGQLSRRIRPSETLAIYSTAASTILNGIVSERSV